MLATLTPSASTLHDLFNDRFCKSSLQVNTPLNSTPVSRFAQITGDRAWRRPHARLVVMMVMGILLLTARQTKAQSGSGCLGDIPDPDATQQQTFAVCSSTSPAYTSEYYKQSFHVPDSVKDPVVNLNITLHVFMPTNLQAANDSGFFINQHYIGGVPVFGSPTLMNYMLSTVTDVNNTNGYDRHSRPRRFKYQGNTITGSLNFPASTYTTAMGNVYNSNTQLTDSRIQYHVTNIYYYTSDYLFWQANSSNIAKFMNYIDSLYPGRLDEGLPVIKPGYAWGPNVTYSSTWNGRGFVVCPSRVYDEHWFRKNLLHEIDHQFGLMHTYFGYWNNQTGNYGISPSPETYGSVSGTNTSPTYSFSSIPVLNCDHADFLKDVFPFAPTFSASLFATDGIPPAKASCGNIFEKWTYESNNNMSGKSDSIYGWTSPLQMGRRIRALHFRPSIRCFVADLASDRNYPWTITASETWDFDIQMYHDIVVKAGNTLSITCKVAMPAGGRIKVERGARLVINGGLVTTWCKNNFWAGIEVEGSTNVDPVTNYLPGGYNADHGIVIIDGGTISHAENGIRNYANDVNGNPDWTSFGGMIRANQATFENNWRDVEMFSAPWAGNGSWFQDCQFKTTGPLIAGQPGYAPGEHVSLWNVSGLSFRACTFTCSTNLYAAAGRGTGIGSCDAVYTLYKDVGGTPCRFGGLNFGIYASNTNPLKVPVVQESFFTNNYTDAVHFAGIHNLSVKNNSVAEFPNTDSFGFYFDQCKNYQVRNNRFSESVSTQAGVGIAANNCQNGAHDVYRNDFTNLFVGALAYGNNSGVNNVADGLRLNCNRFNLGGPNQYDVAMLTAASGTALVKPTVKAVQGDYYGGSSYTLMVRNAYGALPLPAVANGNETQWYIEDNGVRNTLHYCSPNTFCNPSPRDPSVLSVAQGSWPAYNYTLQCPANPPASGGNGGTPPQVIANLNAFISGLQLANSNNRLTQDIRNAVAAKVSYFVSDPDLVNADSVIAIYKNRQANLPDADVLLVFAYLHKRDYDKATLALGQISTENAEWVPLLQRLISLQQNPKDLYGLRGNASALLFFKDQVSQDKKGAASAKALVERASAYKYAVPRQLPDLAGGLARAAQETGAAVREPLGPNSTGVVAYPNPVSDVLRVALADGQDGGAEATLSTALGLELGHYTFDGNGELLIPFSHLSPGVYILTVKLRGELIYQQKIVYIR